MTSYSTTKPVSALLSKGEEIDNVNLDLYFLMEALLCFWEVECFSTPEEDELIS